MLPISTIVLNSERTIVIIHFTAEILEENIKFDPNEILDVQWIDIDKVIEMSNEEKMKPIYKKLNEKLLTNNSNNI